MITVEIVKPPVISAGIKTFTGGSEDYNKGYADGYNDGELAGVDFGYSVGYDDGFASGQAEGFDEGFDAGEESEYNRFWDACQQNGDRRAYTNGFSGQSWNDTTYNPKYEIYCNAAAAANNLFLYSLITDTKVTVHLQNTTTQNSFANANLKRIPLIALYGDVTFSTSFSSCTNLEYIRFSGEIRKSLDLKASTKLDRDSLDNVFEHLSTTVTGQALTVSSVAVANAYTEEEWEARIAPFSNWSISRI